MKQLERLLFLQGQRCFFCRLEIPPGEASIEHLVATSNGGGNEDENCVVCCRAVNAALGNLAVKAKLQAVLNQRGDFVCPRLSRLPAVRAVHPGTPDDERVSAVIADLQKRGSARPRRKATLVNTIGAIFQKTLSEQDVAGVLDTLIARGYVAIDEAKVTYSLPTAAE